MSSYEISRLQKLDILIDDATAFFSVKENCTKFPLLFSVFNYWNDKRGDKFAPNYSQIELRDLPIDVIPRSVVVDVQSDGSDFRFRFWGTKVVDSTGQEMTGKSVTDILPKSLSKKAFDSYVQVFKRQLPIVEKTYGKAFSVDSDELFLRLPMSSNGIDVDIILTAVEIRPKDSEYFKDRMGKSTSKNNI